MPSRSSSTLRLGFLAIILAVECLALAQLPHPWLSMQQPMAAPIVFAAALFFFSRSKLRLLDLDDSPIAPRMLALHLAMLIAIAFCDLLLLRVLAAGPSATLVEAIWFAAIILLAVSITLALFPLRKLLPWLRSLGSAWIYAALTTVAAISARSLVRFSWDATDSALGHVLQRATFAGVHGLLRLFYAGVVSNPATLVLGTPKFQVRIAGSCSGIEGIALMLAFTLGWLACTRRELQLLRAIWLVPLALAAIWGLNLVRIALLIAIGDAGHPGFALNGFHSEAGWIFFNAVAIAFLLAVQRIPALRKDCPSRTP